MWREVFLGNSACHVLARAKTATVLVAVNVVMTGANYRIRTCDLLITNQLLYQLS